MRLRRQPPVPGIAMLVRRLPIAPLYTRQEKNVMVFLKYSKPGLEGRLA